MIWMVQLWVKSDVMSASREMEEWSPRLIYNRYDWISGIEYVDIGMELQSHGIIKDHE